MTRTTSSYFFSPSQNHRALIETLKPELHYSGGDYNAWRETLKGKLRDLLGEMPAERPSLDVRVLWQHDHPLGSIQKIVFTSEPYADVPAYVCIPRNVQKPLTSMICLQGHTTGMHVSIGVDQEDETTPIEVEGDRDFAIGCLKRGIAALCIEQRSFGERAEKVQEMVNQFSGCHDAAMQALMLGRTLIGERVFDVDRAIDYLATRDDVDMNRIGIMGNSGGGTVTMFSVALLDRIAFAMPSCSFCTFRDSIMSIWHCADNYVPGLYCRADMSDIMGAFAPKPIVIVAGESDDIFPIAGTRQAYADLQRIYAAAGASQRCHLVVGEGGHRFYADKAWSVLLGELEKL
jgi:dienelactone hydrolase